MAEPDPGQTRRQAEQLFHHGNALLQSGDAPAAARSFLQAIELSPAMYEAYCNGGVALRRAGLLPSSIQLFQAAIAIRPHLAEAHCNLGVSLDQAGNPDQAAVCYRHAIDLDPGYVAAHYNLGNCLRSLRHWTQAIASYHQALRLDPTLVTAHSNMGLAIKALGDLPGAITAYSQAIDLDPQAAEPRWNRALAHLQLGDWQRGWQGFEWRNRLAPPSERPFPGPRWIGQPIAGQRLLIHWEMGLGDTLQFVRFLSEVARRFRAHIILECQDELHELLRHLPHIQEIIKSTDQLPPYDLHCSLMSLPAILRATTEPQLLGGDIPYLQPDPQCANAWRLRSSTRSPRVGLVWAGRPEHQHDAYRSIPLAAFQPLSAIKGIEFYSLQLGPSAQQLDSHALGFQIINWTHDLHNMADTAGLIANLDAVISVDTAVAHLTGALGKPLWLLLPKVPDWRWGLEHQQTPWYPTARLFRQAHEGDWSGPIQAVAHHLATWRKTA